MKRAIAAISTLLLLAGTASAQTKDPAGVPITKETPQAQPSDAPKRSGSPAIDTGGLRDQLLQGAINTILRPRRPRPPLPARPAPPVIATPDPAPPMIVEPAPPSPAPAALQADPIEPVRPAITPKVVPTAETAPPPRPVEPRVSTPPATEPVTADPIAIEAAPIVAAPVAAARTIASPPAVEVAPTPILAPQPTIPAGLWLVLALFAAAIVAASAYARRARQISRTRAALALHPSLDLMAGSWSSSGLALAGPELAIRARLDDGGSGNA